ncbi:unnamed protein product [Effrenium voratum]|nr:unnamed protein product [Effrenium voratum]CAJ1439835.1 unnamed protein product [Effrenium voratum]
MFVLVLSLLFAFAQGVRDPARKAAIQIPEEDEVPIVTDLSELMPLCHEEIVEDSCLLLNEEEKHEDKTDWTTSEELEEHLTAKTGEILELWDKLGLPKDKPVDNDRGYWVQCQALCKAVVSYVKSIAVLPEKSDLSCYSLGNETLCDLDVRPSKLKRLGPSSEEDIPDFGDRSFVTDLASADPEVAANPPAKKGRVSYQTWEMVERTANLFRIYPAEPRDLEHGDSLLQLAESGMTPEQAKLNKQKEELAKAYMGIVIRAFTGRKTEAQMTRWFGEGTFANATARTEVLRVLNAIDHMISNVHYVFPGPRCRPNTYAYVYPNGYECVKSFEREEPCARMKGTKKYVFYLCPLYFQRPREMVETLVHEGSHHATAFTEDVTFGTRKAYGRTTCQEVAKTDPHKALDNADNFCYYIQDAATEVPDSRFDLSKYQATKCPDFALVDRPDEEGDCRCPRGQLCIYGGEVGCPFSYTSARGTHSTAYFDVECAGCSCAVPDSTTGTSTGTSTSSPTATSTASPTQTCPPFAALTSPDSDGDCYCHGDRECILDGVAGCPFSLTASSGRKSGLYFSAACTGCQCALNTTEVDTTQWCPTFASMRTPDSGGDCYCRAGTSCREGTEASDCPTGNGRRSEGYFSASCESCNCVASD